LPIAHRPIDEVWHDAILVKAHVFCAFSVRRERSERVAPLETKFLCSATELFRQSDLKTSL
jgi:hypothetical protein